MNTKTILITGATSGIGRAAAIKLHALGHRIVGTGRRADRLSDLQRLMPERFIGLSFDVRDRAAIASQVAKIPAEWRPIDVLINNAGNAHGLEPIQNGHWEDWEAMLDINVKGLLAVTEVVLPEMVEAKSGHIINLGSIAGHQAYANGAVYCGSKAAVALITEGMRIDLNPLGIKVSEMKAGMVETEFSVVRFKGDEARAKAVYQGVQPLTGEDVADTLVYMVEAPAHVNLAEVVLMPLAQASVSVYNRKPGVA